MTFAFHAFSCDVIDATGADASSWLAGIVTCDLPSAPEDGARWGLLLSKQGKIQAELLVTTPGDACVSVAVRGGDAQAVRTVLDHHLVMEDVELGPVYAQSWVLTVGAAEDDLAALAAGGFRVRSAPAPFHIPDLALLTHPGSLSELEEALQARGDHLSGAAWDDARVALGLPTFGVDFDGGDNPHQASLERRAVSWQKGCYLGQEVVFMQDARGKVKRRLVRLTSESAERFSQGDRVVNPAGEEVGQVTTGAFGSALARLNAPAFEAGTAVAIREQHLVVEPLDAGLFGRTRPTDSIQK